MCLYGRNAKTKKETTSTFDAKLFAITLFNLLRSDTLESFCALLWEIDTDSGVDVPDSNVKVLFVKSGYILGERIPVERDVDLERKLVMEPKYYERHLQRVFANSKF